MPVNQNFTKNGATFNNGSPPIETPPISNHHVILVSTAPDADPSVFPFGDVVQITTDEVESKLDTAGNNNGFLPLAVRHIRARANCVVSVVRVELDADVANMPTSIIGQYENGTRTGLESVKTVAAPTLICAPGYSHNVSVIAKLAQISKAKNAQFVANILDGNIAELEASQSSLGNNDTGHHHGVYVVGNSSFNDGDGGVTAPSDVVVAALMASQAVYDPIGHKGVPVTGVSRMYEYSYTDESAEGQQVNKLGLCYIAQGSEPGYMLIGNRTITGEFTSKMGLWCELRRRLINIMESQHAERLTADFIIRKLATINEWLKELANQGVVARGSQCVLDETNSATAFARGQWYIRVDWDDYPVSENPIITLQENNSLSAAALG